MQSARNHAYDISECFTPDFKGEAIFNEEKAVQLVSARDAEIRRDAFEAGYAQGHNDTVEGCARDMYDAANDYIAAITGEVE